MQIEGNPDLQKEFVESESAVGTDALGDSYWLFIIPSMFVVDLIDPEGILVALVCIVLIMRKLTILIRGRRYLFTLSCHSLLLSLSHSRFAQRSIRGCTKSSSFLRQHILLS